MIFGIATRQGGTTQAFPDTCKVPTPGGPVPSPFPNIAMLNQANPGTCSNKVKIGNQPSGIDGMQITMSSGDEAGTVGGVISNMIKGPAKNKRKSSKVKFEGKGVVFQTCTFGQNGTNANAPMGVLSMVSNTKVRVTG